MTPGNGKLGRFCSLVLTGLVVLLPVPPAALAGQSDIDLFAGGDDLAPNIMIILDSSGSMRNPPSSGGGIDKKDIAISALNNLITTVNPLISGTTYEENARFGLMTFREDGGLLQQSISNGNTSAVLSAISSHSTTSVGTPISASLLDAGRYYASGESWGSLDDWGEKSSEPSVTNPFDLACRQSFAVMISDGDPNKDAIDVDGYWDTIGDYDNDNGAGETGDDDEEEDEVGEDNMEWSDDIALAMFDRDFNTSLEGKQNVVTHVIGFDTNGANLQRIADHGGGLYRTATNATQLTSVLDEITGETFDDLASYSTAVVPTSRTAFGSAFYNAYFEPDKDDAFWEGHIEAYDISPDGVILDAAGNPAVNAATNEFADPPNPHWDAGVLLRSDTTRNIYTTVSNARETFTGTTAIKAALGITAGEVSLFPNYPSSGVSTVAAAETAIVNYVYGQDAFDEDNDSDATELRPKVLGDIFHSTPIVVGSPSSLWRGESGFDSFYTTYAGRKRVLYVGANDGMFHGFDAGTLTTGDNPLTPAIETGAVFYTAGTGEELFGYVPGLLLDDIKLVPRNDPRTYYFVDGSPVVGDVWLREDASDYTRDATEWTTVSITGFREGGAGYLALDVTNPAATTSGDPHGPYPAFLWEFTDADLGQAWSEPVITRVKVDEGTAGDVCGYNDGDGDCRERWVAIFGGGYDPTADPNHGSFAATTADAGWTTASKAIFMVDIATGTVLDKIEWDASTNPNMIYALPSKPAVIDKNFDGFADVVYIGDLGGQLWKWDVSALGEDSTGSDGIIDNWDHGILFTAPSASDGTETRYKSIYFPPAATMVRRRLVLSFATGEREQLDYEGSSSHDENNRVYVLNDAFPTGAYAFTNSYTELDLTDVTSISADNDSTDAGYFFKVDDGEKFVSELQVFAGFVVGVSFDIDSTNADPCAASAGVSRLYVFQVGRGQGWLTTAATTAMEERYEEIGTGMGSTPRISLAPDPNDDKMYVKTSKGRLITIDPPPRDGSGSSMIYWRENR